MINRIFHKPRLPEINLVSGGEFSVETLGLWGFWRGHWVISLM
jgi:hypothetical protein